MKEYIRYKRRKKNGGMVPIGAVMIAVGEDGTYSRIGWSLCCKTDNFSYAMARKVARDRIESPKRELVCHSIPETLHDTYLKLVAQLQRKGIFNYDSKNTY